MRSRGKHHCASMRPLRPALVSSAPQMEPSDIHIARPSNWFEVAGAIDALSYNWIAFRGQSEHGWPLETTFEREFSGRDLSVPVHRIEQEMVWRFARHAPGFLPAHLLPTSDARADVWLGLIQHYGGPTRFLDVTRSPYVALYFAFEAVGNADRALWAINTTWCQAACARIECQVEDISEADAMGRLWGWQSELVSSIVHLKAVKHRAFRRFKPFTGVFPVDPWKPDSRQIAQQAMFLCSANLQIGFMANLQSLLAVDIEAENADPGRGRDYYPTRVTKVIIPGGLRQEILERLALMNVTAATLFPDLSGLARSMRTLSVRRAGGQPLC